MYKLTWMFSQGINVKMYCHIILVTRRILIWPTNAVISIAELLKRAFSLFWHKINWTSPVIEGDNAKIDLTPVTQLGPVLWIV
jgi:hypothetical protein